MMTTSSRVLPALVALALLVACSERSRERVPDSPFPVRLLPEPAEGVGAPLLVDELDDLSEWRVLDFAGRRLLPARGHPDIVEGNGSVALAAGFLVRLVNVPPGGGHSLVARLRTPPSAGTSNPPPTVGAPCPHLYLPFVHPGSKGGSAQVLGRGTAWLNDERELPLGEVLALRLEKAIDQGGASWTTPPDAEGFASTRLKLGGRDEGEVRAIVVSALTGPVEVASVRLEPKPELDRIVSVESTAAGTARIEEPFIAPVRAAMEWRPSLVVPPSDQHVLFVEPPPGTTALSFGVVVDPGLCGELEPSPPPVSTWRVELLWDGSQPVPLGEGRVTHDGSAPAAFDDVRLPWPAACPDGTPVRLRFSVMGDAAVVFGQPLLRGEGPDRPNVLVVSLDTVRADRIGHLGYERPTTPALDALAAQAATFVHAYTVGPYTLPTHVTLFTGLLPPHHGVTDSWADRLDAARHPYLPRVLAQAGWQTAGFNGGGFLSADFGFADGFDLYRCVDPVLVHDSAYNRRRYERDEPPHVEAIERRAAIEHVADWIAANDDAPWFVFVHTYAPHEYDSPAGTFALFDTAPGSDWGTDAKDISDRLKPEVWPEHPPGPADVEHLSNLYDAALRHTDDRLGSLLGLLGSRGLLDDTIVVVTSDHGEELYEHGGLRHSATLYEEMLHVPLVIDVPGLPARRIAEPVSIADITPTLLELLGLPVHADADGRSLAGLLQGSGTPSRPPALLGHVDTTFSRRTSLREGRLKLIEGDTSTRVKRPAAAPLELYDVVADPGETTNLADDRPADARRLHDTLKALEQTLRSRAVGGEGAEISDEVRAQLEALGYIDNR